jgi:hypothetical protein
VNQFWDSAVSDLLTGALDLDSAPIMVRAYHYVSFESWHTVVADLGGAPVATAPVALDGRAVDGRTLTADPVTFAELPEGQNLTALVLYRSDTNRLIAMIDQRPDLAPLHLAGNGGPVTVTWAGADRRAVISL